MKPKLRYITLILGFGLLFSSIIIELTISNVIISTPQPSYWDTHDFAPRKYAYIPTYYFRNSDNIGVSSTVYNENNSVFFKDNNYLNFNFSYACYDGVPFAERELIYGDSVDNESEHLDEIQYNCTSFNTYYNNVSIIISKGNILFSETIRTQGGSLYGQNLSHYQYFQNPSSKTYNGCPFSKTEYQSVNFFINRSSLNFILNSKEYNLKFDDLEANSPPLTINFYVSTFFGYYNHSSFIAYDRDIRTKYQNLLANFNITGMFPPSSYIEINGLVNGLKLEKLHVDNFIEQNSTVILRDYINIEKGKNHTSSIVCLSTGILVLFGSLVQVMFEKRVFERNMR